MAVAELAILTLTARAVAEPDGVKSGAAERLGVYNTTATF